MGKTPQLMVAAMIIEVKYAITILPFFNCYNCC